jgi:competence protein ComEC
MSFAATVALVWVFRARNDARGAGPGRLPRWLAPAAGLVICSLVAGIATAPVAAAHFNRIAEYGLLANILSVPLMGTVVMPSAVLAGVLAPLGLSEPALRVMELGTRWILGVAEWVAGLDGAVIPVVEPAVWVLPAMALGALWLMLWPGRARWAGVPMVALALAGWAATERPLLLVADSGTLIGLMTPEGRVLSKASGEGFVARNWLEADGDAAGLAEAHARAGLHGAPGTLEFELSGLPAVHLTGRGAAGRVAEHCTEGRLVILGARHDGPAPGDCRLIDQRSLTRSGGRALDTRASGETLLLREAHAVAGARPWTGRQHP